MKERQVAIEITDGTKTEPTHWLRFVEREGKRILQQRWAVTTYDSDWVPTGIHGEWRDVPLRTENDPEDSQ
jgi:hypothetical protein